MERHFFDAIYRLRNSEEIVLRQQQTRIGKHEEADVIDFLRSEWDNERLEYPGAAPDFNEQAALWGAKTVYISAQLILYREQDADVALGLLPFYHQPVDAGAMLSADLCLRTLPAVLGNLRHVNPEDALVARLEAQLLQFHYSAAGWKIPLEKPDFSKLTNNSCLMQLYADRVIERRDRQSASWPELSGHLGASLGAWKAYFWND